MKKYILGLVMMTMLVACSSQETETTKCDSLKCDSTMVVAKDSVKADSVVVEKK